MSKKPKTDFELLKRLVEALPNRDTWGECLTCGADITDEMDADDCLETDDHHPTCIRMQAEARIRPTVSASAVVDVVAQSTLFPEDSCTQS